MDGYKKMLMFLDFVIQREKQRAIDSKGLSAKLTNQKQLKRLQDARNIIRLGYYDYLDFLETIDQQPTLRSV